MSVLDRAALEQSPLADLHAIASELSIDGYRRLRRPELIDAIVDRQSGVADDAAVAEEAEEALEATEGEPTVAEEEAPSGRRRRGRRGGRGRSAAAEEEAVADEQPEEPEGED